MQKALLAAASRTSLFGHFGAAGPAAVSVTLQNGESSRIALKKSMMTKAGEQVAQAGDDPKVEVSSSDEENESKMHPDTRKAYRDDMEESYGVAYATRASEMGYGERYGEAVKAVLDKKANYREMQRGATSDRDQQADAWSGAGMALLRAPCGVLASPSSNVVPCRSGSLKSQFLATSRIQRSGRRNGMFVRRVGGRDSISADSSGIIRKDQVSAGDDNNNVLASASIESAPVKCSEQEEFAKEWAHKPRRVVLFVEPSPFSYISGYKNRYQNFIKYLRELGDEVLVVTTHHGAPAEFLGAKVVPSWSFGLPFYKAVPLSLALSPRIYKEVKNFKPDIIHASSPGIMVFGALIISKLVGVPMVMAYHTHVPMYIPKYTFAWLVKPMWLIIKILHRAADLTLVMSVALRKELRAAGASTAEQIRIWRRGVDSDSFHPRFRNAEMRNKITGGKPDTPTIVHVGRLGVEKNLDFLVQVLGRIPEARLVFVGDGPERTNLENMFAGKNVHFTGMLTGEALSQAYASGDIFITPSESETLGFVVLEAMASGIPVVCARAGGIPDVVNQDGVTGLLYTPGDLEDCVGKLKALIDSPELRERIGHAGRREVEKFDWRASTKQVRNEEYSAAIWFWRRRKQQLANRFSGWFKRPLPQAL